MKDKHLAAAAGEAIVLAGALRSRLPTCCRAAIPPEVLFEVAWPIAVRITRLERRARKSKKSAAAYRQARAEAEELVRARPDTIAAVPDLLANTVPFDAGCWRTVLVPGMPATELEAA